MNITVNLEIDKDKICNFDTLISSVYEGVMNLGCKIVRDVIETIDEEIMKERDKKLLRAKGLRKTTIKTRLGEIEYSRRLYLDQTDPEHGVYVFPVDEALGVEKIGLISKDLCVEATSMVCETAYRTAAENLSALTGTSISHQGVWNLVQKVGNQQQNLVERHTELRKNGKNTGVIESKLLYEENDGIWLKLQGRSREESGQPSKEMKVGIAYDGAIYQGKKPYRRILDSKVAYASFEDAKTFRKHKEGLVASRYDVDSVELRIINGDGANWVTKSNGKGAQIHVLDEFHRNEKITTCIKDPDFGKLVRKILFEEKDIPKLLEVLEAQINSVEDEDEKASISELLRYFEENKDALLSPYDRNIEIPETRQPGVIHHARLGSMESNVFTLVGNRMKDRRHCWSVNGANNLALLICLKKTVGFAHLFENVEINAEEEWVDTGAPLSVSEALKKVGTGSEYYNCSSSTYSWMRNVLADVDVMDLSFL